MLFLGLAEPFSDYALVTRLPNLSNSPFTYLMRNHDSLSISKRMYCSSQRLYSSFTWSDGSGVVQSLLVTAANDSCTTFPCQISRPAVLHRIRKQPRPSSAHLDLSTCNSLASKNGRGLDTVLPELTAVGRHPSENPKSSKHVRDPSAVGQKLPTRCAEI